jgi:4-alpha-glucanotransferase
MQVTISQLHHLAALYGIAAGYLDADQQVRLASPAALLAVLKTLGAPVLKIEDVPPAFRAKRQAVWRQPLEPVIVVWENSTLAVNLRLRRNLIGRTLEARLITENGREHNFTWQTGESQVLNSAFIEKTPYAQLRLYLPDKLPLGYHRLQINLPGQICESRVISAPLHAYKPPDPVEKIWGLFLPLYALNTRVGWGAGDLGDYETLLDWVAGAGGKVLATLPLLPSFFDPEFGPSPYMPASRLFWNEFYLDIKKIPLLAQCPAAREMIESPDFQNTLISCRLSHYVNYETILRLKRTVLEKLADDFFAAPSARLDDFHRFMQNNPQVADYALFRAAGESHGIRWRDWPPALRMGRIREGDYSPRTAQYYRYSQWLAFAQINDLARQARESNLSLYMDLPVGVHPDSYDSWREKDSFVLGVTGGAPPDPVFTRGQNWRFPPLDPEKIRRTGYDYLIRSLRHQMQAAGMLRIDHMMNFHRLFWIPEGMECREGVYVSYRPEEMYAILTLESRRHNCMVIGEDLGIVPPEVRPQMQKHAVYRMFVGQYQLIVDNQIGQVPADSVASLNTHDMPPFASFWDESDIFERPKLKTREPSAAGSELEQIRQMKRSLISILAYRGLDNTVSQDTQATLRAILNLLAASPAYALMINLEDLWLEHKPQNIPGTIRRQNWRRKARYAFEKFAALPFVLDELHEINNLRKKAR